MTAMIDKYSDEDIVMDEIDVQVLKSKLQNIMWDYVGILRDKKSLTEANELIYRLKADFPRETKCLNREEY